MKLINKIITINHDKYQQSCLPMDSKIHILLPICKGLSVASGKVSLKCLTMAYFNAHLYLHLWKTHLWNRILKFTQLNNIEKIRARTKKAACFEACLL